MYRDTLTVKYCWKEQVLPRNLLNLGKGYPVPMASVFSLLRSSRACLKIEIAGIIRGSLWRLICYEDLNGCFAFVSLTNPAIECGGAKMYYNT